MNRWIVRVILVAAILLPGCSDTGSLNVAVVSKRYDVCLSRLSSAKTRVVNRGEDIDAVEVVLTDRVYSVTASYFLQSPLHELATRHPFVRDRSKGFGKGIVLMDVYLDRIHRIVLVRRPKLRAVFVELQPTNPSVFEMRDIDQITNALRACDA